MSHRSRLIQELGPIGITEKECVVRWAGLRVFHQSCAAFRYCEVLMTASDDVVKVGDNGWFSREFAAYLARPEKPERETRSRPTRTQIVPGTT